MHQRFRERVRHAERLLGTLISLPSPEVAEIAALAGYDWLFIDGEHGALDALMLQRMLQAVGGRCPCLVRVPLADEVAIKRALDVGAAGIIVPQVNTAEQARAIVRWCKYPPDGGRGVGIARAHGYGGYFGDYVATANDAVTVVIQAEHADAVRNIAELAAVDGIDAVFIGPYDLSASLGRTGQLQHPQVQGAIAEIAGKCRAAGRALGIFGLDPLALRAYTAQGFSLLAAGCDSVWLTQAARENLQSLRG